MPSRPPITCGILVLALTAIGCQSLPYAPASPTPERLVRQLEAPAPRADAAYRQLLKLGPAAIPPLLADLERTVGIPYQGTAQVSPASSSAAAQESVAVIRLYIVEGIRLGAQHPHTRATLGAGRPSDSTRTQHDALQLAIQAYRSWWWAHEELPFEVWRSVNPLESTGVRWY